jgi:hypothetical protein
VTESAADDGGASRIAGWITGMVDGCAETVEVLASGLAVEPTDTRMTGAPLAIVQPQVRPGPANVPRRALGIAYQTFDFGG